MSDVHISEGSDIEKLTHEYRDLQEKIETCGAAEGRLSAQETENKIVLEELEGLEDDAQVYKMIGCVLTKQSKEESIENVKKRLQFIQEEKARNQTTAKVNQDKLNKLVQLIQQQQQQKK